MKLLFTPCHAPFFGRESLGPGPTHGEVHGALPPGGSRVYINYMKFCEEHLSFILKINSLFLFILVWVHEYFYALRYIYLGIPEVYVSEVYIHCSGFGHRDLSEFGYCVPLTLM